MSSMSAPALRLPALAAMTFAPPFAEATLVRTLIALVTVRPAATVRVDRVWPVPLPTNSTS